METSFYGAIAIGVIFVGSAFFLGFSRGWKRGQKELLVSLERARRITQHMNK